ncbi:TMEM175 family protein [Halococcus sediminicola]|uniref:TMEM175 family protein n=1 Tax=Halococcus sediminicola TaxID=1264579 RepID=UPI00067904F5|nr:TMEM175 family protein [Halococcus sediminicola]
MSLSYSHESTETDRLLALSDGVIAIAITLLVLDINIPTIPAGSTVAVLRDLITKQWQEFFAYLLSFFVVGFYWVLHRRVFIHIDRHNRGVLWLNLLFLLFVGFVPYATSMFTAYPDQFGVTFYAGMLALTGFSLTLLWGYASRKELIEEGLTSLTVGIQAARFLASPVVFVLSAIIAMFDPTIAILSWLLLLPINSVLESRLVASLEDSLSESATPPH